MLEISHHRHPKLEHRGIPVPGFFYGTAWKESETEALTRQALGAGFLGIDTANQRRHYYEAGVGRAIEQILAEGRLERTDLFIQTKFTYASGQDHRLPYDAKAAPAEQVRQSFASSLAHLKTAYVDSFVLHGPSIHNGLSGTDWEVWRAMEELQKSGAARLIGASNMTCEQLHSMLKKAEIKPAFIQNRCYAKTKWDAEMRELCRENDILYQGFSLLTANAAEVNHPEILAMAKKLECAPAQVVFRFCMQIGMIPLTGTTSKKHMQEDLAAFQIGLSGDEVEIIENISSIM